MLRGWNNLAQKLVIENEREIEGNLVYQMWDEVAKPRDARIAEFLRFRERFFVQVGDDGIYLPTRFKFSQYLEEHACKNLKKLVTIDVGQQALI